MTTEKHPDFGDIVLIEQKRYGAPNEFYRYKVIRRFVSTYYVTVPVDANGAGKKEVWGEKIEEVVSCICEGISETDVLKFRLCDVKLHDSPVARLTAENEELRKEVDDLVGKHEQAIEECEKLIVALYAAFDCINPAAHTTEQGLKAFEWARDWSMKNGYHDNIDMVAASLFPIAYTEGK
jgi:hypothetical protein